MRGRARPATRQGSPAITAARERWRTCTSNSVPMTQSQGAELIPGMRAAARERWSQMRPKPHGRGVPLSQQRESAGEHVQVRQRAGPARGDPADDPMSSAGKRQVVERGAAGCAWEVDHASRMDGRQLVTGDEEYSSGARIIPPSKNAVMRGADARAPTQGTRAQRSPALLLSASSSKRVGERRQRPASADGYRNLRGSRSTRLGRG